MTSMSTFEGTNREKTKKESRKTYMVKKEKIGRFKDVSMEGSQITPKEINTGLLKENDENLKRETELKTITERTSVHRSDQVCYYPVCRRDDLIRVKGMTRPEL